MTMLKFEKFSSTSQRDPVGAIIEDGSLAIRVGEDVRVINTNGKSMLTNWESLKSNFLIKSYIYAGEDVIISF